MRLARQIVAWSAAAALLAASVYAPLFHIHTAGADVPLLHAHFPDLETTDDDSVVHIEQPHSHAGVRSVDVLTTTAPQIVRFETAVHSVYAALPELRPSSGFVAATPARAHAPPALTLLIPRAPPA